MSKEMTGQALAAAIAGAVCLAALGSSGISYAADGTKEKCYGIAKAGENGCAAANGSHSCAGQAKTAFDGLEWKLVDAGTCTKMEGRLEPFEGVGSAGSKEKKS